MSEPKHTNPGQSSPAPPGLAAQPQDAYSRTGFHLAEPLAFFTWPRIIKVLVLAGLFFWIFHGTLIRLFRVWWEIPDWSHGLLIPVFSFGILLFIHDRWKHVPLRPTYWGLVIVAAGLMSNILAVWWLKAIPPQDYSWWLLLVGLVVTLCGWRFALAIWFPLFFILFGIRVGGVIYDPVSTRLQQIAAFYSTLVLKLFGIHADLAGVTIELFTRSGQQTTLQVAEACSGMRILMAFLALGALMAYMVRRPWWHRAILVLAILPIAITSNVVRVAGMGLLYYFDRPELARGYAHTLEGLLMLPIALGLFWLLHWLLSRLVIEEKTPGPASPAGHPRPVADAAESRPKSIRAALTEPHFLVLAGLMLLVAVSWGEVIRRTGTVFTKKPVPLKQALDRFPRRIVRTDGTQWVAMDEFRLEHELLEPDIEKFLGATHPYRLRGDRHPNPDVPDRPDVLRSPQYIQRFYKLVNGAGKEIDPANRAYFFVSYYTGTPDPVPHVPDRCYLGGGYTENTEARRDLVLDIDGQQVPVRCMQFFGRGMDKTNVVYFFLFNGRMSSRHLEVRRILNSPFGRHAYYCKVEINFPNVQDLGAATESAWRLLADFLPILNSQFLPDWEKFEK